MPSKIPAIKRRETSGTRRKRQKRKSRSRNPYLEEGKPTKRLQHLIWCANFEENFPDREALRQAIDRWVDEENAEMLDELAKIVRDCRRRFESLSIKERAIVYAIRAYREVCADPRFDSARPSLPILKAKTLELMASNAPLLPNETVEEQKKRLERKVDWTNVYAILPVARFVRKLGRPTKPNSKTPGDIVPTIFSWDIREIRGVQQGPLALGLMNRTIPGT
jgi:hypothetical protein